MILFDADGLTANFHKRLEQFIPWEIFSNLSRDDQAHVLREAYHNDPDFFYKLEPNLQFFDLIEWAEKSGQRWGILTATGTDHHDEEQVKEQKLLWHEKHFNIGRDKITVVTHSSEKADYARPGYILVDDYGKNCEEFISKGGMALKVEANSYSSIEVINSLAELVAHNYTSELCAVNP